MVKSLGRTRAASLYSTIQREIMDEAMLMAELMGAEGCSDPFEDLSLRYADISRLARVEGALIAIDPFTGAITAMVGGGQFTENNQLNRTFQACRQPGSAFKAFVYGSGIESRRITPATAFLDLPLVYYERDKKYGWKNKAWTPSNYGKSFHGRVLARKALAQSLNITAVTVYENVGGKRIASFASRMMGLPVQRFEIDPTLALGSTELTPMEMARGFAVYASGGYSVSPHAVTEIYDSSKKPVYKRNKWSGRKKVISPRWPIS